MSAPRNLPAHQAAYVLDAQAACPIVLGETGLWLDGSDAPATRKWRNADGTDNAVGASTKIYDPVRLVDTAVLVSASYDYDPVALTLTQKANNTQANIDGKASALGDVVLRVIGDAQDGKYAYTRLKGASIKAQWTRTPDMNITGEFVNGAVASQWDTSATSYKGTLWELSLPTPFAMDTGIPVFTQTAAAVSLTAVNAALGEAAVLNAKVTIATAAVKTLHATPVALIAAPGAGKYIEIVGSPLARLVYGTAGYDAVAATDYLEMRYTDASGSLITTNVSPAGFADATADAYRLLNLSQAAVVPVANAVIVAHVAGTEWFGAAGDSALHFDIYYRVRTLAV